MATYDLEDIGKAVQQKYSRSDMQNFLDMYQTATAGDALDAIIKQAQKTTSIPDDEWAASTLGSMGISKDFIDTVGAINDIRSNPMTGLSKYFNVMPSHDKGQKNVSVGGDSMNLLKDSLSATGMSDLSSLLPTSMDLTTLGAATTPVEITSAAMPATTEAALADAASLASTGGSAVAGTEGLSWLASLCCFIIVEAEKGLPECVRCYREQKMTYRNRRGYYRIAEVLVPAMRRSKSIFNLVRFIMVKPLIKYGSWYYSKCGAGWVFKPLELFWMQVFRLAGFGKYFIRHTGEVV